MRRASSELNTAHIYETSTIVTPTASSSFFMDTAGDSNKAGAFFMEMPDNGPSMRMRGLGA
jgi:hypothetical protein